MSSGLMFEAFSVRNLDLKEARVMVRVDLNDQSGATLEARIDQILPTINLISATKPKYIVIVSHMGNPEGKDDRLSLLYAAELLSKKIHKRVRFIDSIDWNCITDTLTAYRTGEIVVLDNIRFFKEETEDGETVADFRSKLTNLCDIFVNDAFSVVHKEHSSVVGVGALLNVMGLLMEKELGDFRSLRNAPKRPFLAIIGGVKFEKLNLMSDLLDYVDELAIGGALAMPFLHVLLKTKIEQTLYDPEGEKEVITILKKAKEKNIPIYLPRDLVCLNMRIEREDIIVEDVRNGVSDGFAAMDVGPMFVATVENAIKRAKTVFWNGPVGVFETEKFSESTKQILMNLSLATSQGVFTVLAGGHTMTSAVRLSEKLTFSMISTAGLSALKLLVGQSLPGMMCLSSPMFFAGQYELWTTSLEERQSKISSVLMESIRESIETPQPVTEVHESQRFSYSKRISARISEISENFETSLRRSSLYQSNDDAGEKIDRSSFLDVEDVE
ncbi:hypothetical protein ACOME3_006135 [Neoechinorhynchus agilis]